MKTVTGVFGSRSDAEHAMTALHAAGLSGDNLSLLTPGNANAKLPAVPHDTGEQSGMGKAIGAIVGAAAGMSGAPLVVAAVIPGVGPITAVGLFAGAILAAAGAKVGAVAGGKLENSMTEGLPEDELFVYEDALRKGRSVVLARVS